MVQILNNLKCPLLPGKGGVGNLIYLTYLFIRCVGLLFPPFFLAFSNRVSHP
jgi:hypothetical protein